MVCRTKYSEKRVSRGQFGRKLNLHNSPGRLLFWKGIMIMETREPFICETETEKAWPCETCSHRDKATCCQFATIQALAAIEE